MPMRNTDSRVGLNGIAGTSGPARRAMGASRYSKACSAMTAATSPPIPSSLVSSCTMMALPVFLTDARTVSSSSGRTVRRSTTSTLTPSLWIACAASMQWCNMRP